jgi:uncharacterized protein
MFRIRKSWYIIGIYCAGIIISFFFIPKLKIIYHFKDFYSDDDPELKFYQEFSDVFGSDELVLMVGVKNEKGAFRKAFLEKIDEFTKECEKVHFVDRAYSMTTLNDLAKTPFGFLKIPFIHIDDSLRYLSDSIRIFSDPRLPGWLISKDAKVLSVILNVNDIAQEKERDELISDIDNLMDRFLFPESHLAGNINAEIKYIRMIKQEIRFNMILCATVVILFFIIFFRSFAGVVYPVITTLIAMLLFYGLLGIFNRPINILSTLFPTIIMVVCTSGLIHIYSRYNDALIESLPKKKALKDTIRELTIRLLMTSLTTAIGFFSLASSSMKPIRNFGIEAGTGVMLAFIVSITLFPSIIDNIKMRVLSGRQSIVWENLIKRINKVVDRFPDRIILVTVLMTCISIVGIFNIDKNNYILGNFSEKSDIMADFDFFEKNLSGVRSFKVAVLPVGRKPVNDITVLKEVDKLQNYLEKLPALGVLFSPVTVYKTINKIYYGGLKENYFLPKTQDEINKYDDIFSNLFKEQNYQFMDEGRTKGVIEGRMMDIGSERAKELQIKIEQWISENIDNKIVDFRFTGISFLGDRSNDYLIRNMFLNLAIAFLIVSFLMLILFKNLKMLIISLIPNIIPLLAGGMIIGFSGIVLNGYVAIVFTIGFVIAVDNTIHFLAKFRVQRSLRQSIIEARHESLKATGKAMIMTTVILFFGFLVLIHSDIMGVFSQGVLISSILIIALLADLFLLPVLIMYFLKD